MTDVGQIQHFILQVSDVPVSLNVLLRMHWSRRREYNRAWAWSIKAALNCQRAVGDRGLPLERARVLIIQHRKQKLDHDNLAGSCKPILDGMK